MKPTADTIARLKDRVENDPSATGHFETVHEGLTAYRYQIPITRHFEMTVQVAPYPGFRSFSFHDEEGRQIAVHFHVRAADGYVTFSVVIDNEYQENYSGQNVFNSTEEVEPKSLRLMVEEAFRWLLSE